ncbi:2-oxo acid dehydrogenase subunit E2 [Nocardia flavorosea]|uniref:Dihydrolipoamide acetyltransferase component of pyruvate dehydrogenase complex n=2 Tax=Nocardia flavorosea TaxID=53429 RepID=A0A846YHD0_9NOCA|nr:2-oxo acid dehydrogenase subunit E2 [Nocardia flavorosea]
MPRLSDTMEDGVVAAWLKQVGDPVIRGEIVAEIETDKALMELEAYEDGVLEQILAETGTRVPIGEPIAIVGDGSAGAAATAPAGSGQRAAGAAGDDAPEAAPARERPSPAPTGAAGDTTRITPADTGRRQKSSPLARRVARELGVHLAAVTGTGPGGRITRRDVESAHDTTASGTTREPAVAGTPAPVAPDPHTGDHDEIPLTSIQKVSAARLAESKQQAPHIYLTTAIDVTDLFTFRTRLNDTLTAAGNGKVSVNDLLVKAVALTLRANPAINVSFAEDALRQHRSIHLGIAVATPAGLLVPVVHDADRKSISVIAAETRDKAERARNRKLRTDEMAGGTFTISNLGMYGIEHFSAVINPPESAILAIGAATDELRLAGDKVVSRKVLRLTMSADHRAIDGAGAAQFLAQLKSLVETPLRILT